MASTTIPSGSSPSQTEEPIKTPFLIVGAGPAGAALASFLGQYGLTGIMVSMAAGTAKEPRAHITNVAALECLRDIGLQQECLNNATPSTNMEHTRWCYTMAGEEFARIHSWGNQPDRQGDYAAASPCKHIDLPQTLLEPILVKNATAKGWKVRFDTAFVKFERDSPDAPIISTLKDTITGQEYTVRSKYLFGCDGARSQVARQLALPLLREPGQGIAINVLVEADLTEMMKHRTGNLHWIMQPDVVHPPWAWSTLARMVKPWHEWMFIMFPDPGTTTLDTLPSPEECLKQVNQTIGDASISPKILDVSKWQVNEIIAERYSDGNIYCMGDAVHRHPPFNGLGSNTCIQDAYNLAWKVAFVERGLAGPSLLDSFSAERQPIGEGVIRRANQGLRDHIDVWKALGVLPEDVEERKRDFAELSAPTKAGRERRELLRKAVKYTEHEFGGIGIEMNQRYESSATYLADEKFARPAPPEDPVLHHQVSTYPGSRLPHAWVNKRTPNQAPISTVDLAGNQRFCLLTGIGGDKWKQAAKEASKALGFEIVAYTIGWNQDWEDVYDDWARLREVDEDGCVLVRPDRTVGWRSMDNKGDCGQKLLSAMTSILGRK
ncbi:Hypothetical protein R9X50_00072100 [Acrodontium crateriforme]|uniref:FAD-binding domain-containing protein n=1 Tax=Acrodontium crateriforme TaxID=150365 RepID=A0AAQ3LY27_9PEZI|nr:Hypothetical protein R9X50_00072100 [Acrodontium crateriforme]